MRPALLRALASWPGSKANAGSIMGSASGGTGTSESDGSTGGNDTDRGSRNTVVR